MPDDWIGDIMSCGVGFVEGWFCAAGASWSLAAPNDLIRGSAGCVVALVHCGLLSVGSPHSSASRPPSPQGKALRCTVYHKEVQHYKFVQRCESLPRGGRWPGQSRVE